MPIYEFRCDACGAQLEALVGVGEEASCERCGAERTTRVYSSQAAAFRLVGTPAETRRQERRNADLRRRTKERFKRGRAAARARKGTGSDGRG